MKQEKIFIKNHKEQNVAILLDTPESPKGLAFVMHGLGGFKEQDHIEAFAQAFLENGFITVRFDTTNTLGESDGKYEDATITNYYEDLEDVIRWAKSQDWYREPFALAGHSLGGICTALYAENYPREVLALAPISTVVSGKLSLEATPQEERKSWQETGWRIRTSTSKNIEIRLKWSHMEDRLSYDLIPEVNKLTMPVLLIVGEKDSITPPAHQRLFYEQLPAEKEIHVIKGAEHTFREKNHLEEIKEIMDTWIKKYKQKND